MKRLRDEEAAPGSIEGAAVDLLRAARPLDISPLARGRVRVGLARVPASPTWLLRPAVVMALLLLGATVAGASFGVRLLARGRAVVVPLVAPAAHVPVAPAVVYKVEELAPPAAEPSPPPIVGPRPHAHHVAARVAPVAPPVLAPVPVDDPALVATALRALRREHDPARAGSLVEEYLRRWPAGALTEEAMALAVEAAAAGQDARAGEWAARYLRRFPNGRFRDVVSRSAPSP